MTLILSPPQTFWKMDTMREGAMEVCAAHAISGPRMVRLSPLEVVQPFSLERGIPGKDPSGVSQCSN